MNRKLQISTSPHLKDDEQTSWIMKEILLYMVPVLGLGVYYFGFGALWVVASAMLGAWLPERIWNSSGVKDNSTLLTGALLGLTLPAGIALWMAFLGGFVAIVMGKLIWGGLGQNVFNPALVGRAFLQASFPIAITTWYEPLGWKSLFYESNLAFPLMKSVSPDGITGATPLAMMKFDGKATDLQDLLLGSTGGSIGETSGLLLLGIGAVLVYKKLVNWRIIASTVLTILVGSGIFYLLGESFPSPLFTLMSGGFLFGLIFMATDPVTSPLAPKGLWWYGFGIGFLVILIRYFGGLPEGVMFAILLMNTVTPLINKYVKIRTYGHAK